MPSYLPSYYRSTIKYNTIASKEKIKMKGFLILILLLVTLSSFASADTIVFKNGTKTETEMAWEEGELISEILSF